jgi:integrase
VFPGNEGKLLNAQSKPDPGVSKFDQETLLEAMQGVLDGTTSPEEMAALLHAAKQAQEAPKPDKPSRSIRPRETANRVKFEVPTIKKLEPQAKEYTLRDTEQPGLALRVMPTGRKVFVVEARVRGGSARRVTIGPFGKVTLDAARRQAKQITADLVQGIDPARVKAEKRRTGVTLQAALDEYLQRDLKASTKADVRKAFKQLEDWLDLPVTEITPAMCEDRHRKLTERATKSGLWANLVFRYLRAVLNQVSAKYAAPDGTPLLAVNPVKRLSATKQWNRMKRRRTFVKPEQMAEWWKAATEGLAGLKFADEMRDCLILSMLTGVRPGEALGLQWTGVDVEGRTLTFLDTKNHSDHELPLPEWLAAHLKARRGLLHDSPYVFVDANGKRPKSVRSALDRIESLTGWHVMATDLRRTFITAAEALDVGPYALKRLLNHTINNGDVTAGYIVPTTDRLRPTMQRIEDSLLRHAGVKGGEVIELRRGRA